MFTLTISEEILNEKKLKVRHQVEEICALETGLKWIIIWWGVTAIAWLLIGTTCKHLQVRSKLSGSVTSVDSRVGEKPLPSQQRPYLIESIGYK